MNAYLLVCNHFFQCLSYYPKTPSNQKEMKVRVKVKDSGAFSEAFFLNKAHSTLLKLDDNVSVLLFFSI